MTENHKDLNEVRVVENDDDTCFPAGMRVLAVEDNIVCRANLVNVLEKCHYKVTTATEASEALKLLRQQEEKFDIVISNVERHDIDGFKLLETINLEMDIPVVLVSARDDHENAIKGIKSGASAYLIKPVRVEEMKNIWQHVVRRNLNKSDKSSITTDIAYRRQTPPQEQEVKDKSVKLDDEDPSETPHHFEGESSTRKKTRVIWTPDLHFKFLNALRHLGEKDAVPNKILKFMDEPGLTRENIASHLQKYRNNMKKQNTGGGQGNNNLVVVSSHRSYDSEMNSRTLIQGPNSTSNYIMNLRPQIPMPTNQAQHIQHPNFVGHTRLAITEYPFSSTGNYRPPSDFRLSTFPPSNKGVPFCVDDPNGVSSSQTITNGVHFPGYLNSMEHHQILCGDRYNSTHPFIASSASETGAFYQQQYPFNFPSMNLPAINRDEEGSIHYTGVGDSNNGGRCINFPRSLQGQENIPSFQQSRVQHGEVISFEDNDIENIPLSDVNFQFLQFSNQGSHN